VLGGFRKIALILLPFKELIDLLKLVLFNGLTRLLMVALLAFSLDSDSNYMQRYSLFS
jgi:hypothetical protein